MTVRRPIVRAGGKNTQLPSGDTISASSSSYDNGTSGLAAENVQDAIDEIASSGGGGGGGGREQLTDNRTYYVSTSGSDSNNGLSSENPFATIQKAIDVAAALDTVIYNVEIVIGAGTYTEDIKLATLTGGGYLQITGNVDDPSTVVLQSASSSFHLIDVVSVFSRVFIRGMTLQKTGGAGGVLINVGQGSWVNINGLMRFGASATGHINAYDGGVLWIYSNYSIVASSPFHWQSNRGGVIHLFNNITLTLTGTPAFSNAFAISQNVSTLSVFQTAFSGGATGVRYRALTLAIINVFGAGATFLPGNSAGVTADSGVYR